MRTALLGFAALTVALASDVAVANAQVPVSYPVYPWCVSYGGRNGGTNCTRPGNSAAPGGAAITASVTKIRSTAMPGIQQTGRAAAGNIADKTAGSYAG